MTNPFGDLKSHLDEEKRKKEELEALYKRYDEIIADNKLKAAQYYGVIAMRVLYQLRESLYPGYDLKPDSIGSWSISHTSITVVYGNAGYNKYDTVCPVSVHLEWNNDGHPMAFVCTRTVRKVTTSERARLYEEELIAALRKLHPLEK